MVHHIDVVVKMSTGTVGMRHDKEVRAVHPLRELHTEVVHPLDVLRVLSVELFRRKVLRVGVHLIATTERSRDLLCTRDDRLGRVQRACVPSSARGAVFHVLSASRTCAE